MSVSEVSVAVATAAGRAVVVEDVVVLGVLVLVEFALHVCCQFDVEIHCARDMTAAA